MVMGQPLRFGQKDFGQDGEVTYSENSEIRICKNGGYTGTYLPANNNKYHHTTIANSYTHIGINRPGCARSGCIRSGYQLWGIRLVVGLGLRI